MSETRWSASKCTEVVEATPNVSVFRSSRPASASAATQLPSSFLDAGFLMQKLRLHVVQ